MIDKLMRKYGYKKTHESRYYVRYEKYHTRFKFTQCIDICHKKNIENIMISYSKEPINMACGACGVEIPVLLLCWIKAKQLSIKYKWWVNEK